jgi:hypothetical protein
MRSLEIKRAKIHDSNPNRGLSNKDLYLCHESHQEMANIIRRRCIDELSKKLNSIL